MRNRAVISPLAWFLGLALLASCSESAPPKPTAKPAPAKPPGPVAVSPVTAPSAVPGGEAGVALGAAVPPPVQEEYSYNPSGRRDPFKSLIVASAQKKNIDLLPPLQRREVADLKYVAVVWGELGTYAMLEMPDGKGYAVRVGTRVGPNRGVVKRITARDLTVVEQYVDFFGETRSRDIVLELRTREEGLE